ncbi:MAG: hypothetical protein CVU84_07640 [Firmicutes bacterium HGW-Firmicutes-1]|nr:MAG: hypothetical protein CVU84_07640 [Firmicutes bacterium HGW-Firmicutes-1]
MYKYDEVISVLTSNFSEMKEIFEKDEDYYEDLPYLFYESEFVPFIVECANNGSEGILKKAFEIVEELMKNGDEKVVNLVEVAVVESIFLDTTISNKKIIEEYFGTLTKNSYQDCTK